MSSAVVVIGWIETVAFCGLGLIALVDWVRHPDRQRAALAWAMGLLALVTLTGRMTTASGQEPRLVSIVTVPLFLGSGYALVVFRHTFIPIRARTLRILLGIVVVVSGLFDALPLPSDPVQPPPLYLAAAIAFVMLWCGLIVEPIVRFWMASRHRPAVQRARLRALSLGYGGIVAVLLVVVGVAVGAGTSSSQNQTYQLVIGIVVLGIIPLLYVSFAPPGWLRRLWRGREETAFRLATCALLVEDDPRVLAGQALDWALRLTGTDAGVIAGDAGEVLAAVNLHADVLRMLGALPAGEVPRLVDIGADVRHPVTAMLAPLRAPGVAGSVAVIAGVYTPVFGADELKLLGEYGLSVGAALGRVRLVQELEHQTERRERLLGAVSGLGDGLVVTEGTGLVYVNRAYCSIRGYTIDEVLAAGIPLDVVAAQPPGVVEGLAATPVDGRPDHFETALLARDGHAVEVEISRRRQGSGATARTTAIVRDVSDRVRSARELARRAVDLERSNAALEEFAYVASHDLQEPLRMVTSYLQLLSNRYRESLDGDAHDFIDFAVDGARRMQGLIDGLLLYSRVTTLDAPMTALSLADVVAEVQANLRPTIEQSGAMVTVGQLPTVVGERSQLVQLFQNLVSNAIKFRADPAPEVSVAARRGDGEWLVTVMDNGIGIEPRHAERVFQIFKRLHPASEYPGTGIGLSICRQVVERHGGRIWVESVPGEGASVHFTLPDDRADGEPATADLIARRVTPAEDRPAPTVLAS